jgi:hypothetical protein
MIPTTAQNQGTLKGHLSSTQQMAKSRNPMTVIKITTSYHYSHPLSIAQTMQSNSHTIQFNQQQTANK